MKKREENEMPYRKHWSQINASHNMTDHRPEEERKDGGISPAMSHPQEQGSKQSQPVASKRKQERPQGHDRYVMTAKAAEILCLSPRTLERMRIDGTGPKFSKAGGGLRSRVLYKVGDLHKWLEAQSFHSTSEYGE
jgi:hypothetical protein